jgi:hypothetical protein
VLANMGPDVWGHLALRAMNSPAERGAANDAADAFVGMKVECTKRAAVRNGVEESPPAAVAQALIVRGHAAMVRAPRCRDGVPACWRDGA